MISFRSTPFRIDYAGNHPRFQLNTSPYTTAPQYGSVTYAIYQIPYADDVETCQLVLTTPYGDVSRHIVDGIAFGPSLIRATSIPDQMVERLLDRLCNERKVTDHYQVEAFTGKGVNELPCCFLRLTSRIADAQQRPALSYQQDGVGVNSVGGNPVIHFWESQQGTAAVPRSNYHIKGRFLINRQHDNGGDYIDTTSPSEFLESPEIAIWSEGAASQIGTCILQSYFNRMDIPSYGEQLGIYTLRNNIIRYRLRVGDVYGDTNGFLTTTREFLLLNATVRRERFITNTTDDDSVQITTPISSATQLIGWMLQTIRKVRLFRGCEYYMYVANFTTSNRILTVKITVPGSETSTTYTVPAESIVRIPVGTQSLPPTLITDDVFGYTVTLNDNSSKLATLQVELEEKPHFGRVLLLQNSLGIAETFIIDHVVFERETGGNEVVVDSERMVELSEHGTRLTLRTGYHPKEEMRLLADAFTNPDNYLLDGTLAYRINFTPGTLTATDEGEDLQSAEMQVTIGRPIVRVKQEATSDIIPENYDQISDNLIIHF